MSREVLRSPKGKLVEGDVLDGVWTPASGMGLSFTLSVLIANGWERVDGSES